MKKLSILLAVILLALSFTACGKTESTLRAGTAEDPILCGVVGSQNEVWDFIIEKLKKEDIHVKLVVFTDYNTPNDALQNRDIDINAFQHKIFLKGYNDANNTDIVSIGDTIVAPLGVYSKKIKSLDEFPEGGTIAIPNDPTNNGRSLILLETAGLIKLKEDAPEIPTQADIAENIKNIVIEELDASQTPRALDDVDAAIINDDMAIDAGLLSTRDAIYIEEITDKSGPYLNIIAAKEENKDSEILKKIVAAYQSDDTEAKINEIYKGSRVPAWK